MTEIIVSRLVALLTANLPAKLDAIDAEMNDGIVLDDIKEFVLGERARTAGKFPSCWVLGESAELEMDENVDQQGGLYPLGSWRHRILVLVSVVEGDDDRRGKRLYRYAKAVTQVIRANEGYVNGVTEWWRAKVVRHDFRARFEHDQPDLLEGHVRVSVEVSAAH